MRIICDSAELAKACMNIQRSVSAKSTIPSLEGILIEAEDSQVRLTGYDLEVGSIISLECQVYEKGRVVLNARNLCDILRMVPEDVVSIECDERNISRIKSGETEYSLIGISANDYPELPSINKYSVIGLNQAVLRDMIKKTIFSVSTGERNPVHTGIKFEVEQGKIVLIAVDGARLAIRREIIDCQDKELSFIVPAKTLNEVMKLAAEDDKNIEILVGDRHIIFRVEGYEIISRLLEGNFLNYKSAIPLSWGTKIIVDTRRLIECIERTSLIITDKSSPVRCTVENGIMKFSSVTAIGTANDKMVADIEGKEIEIGFNNRFLLDCLKACDAESLKLELSGSNQPITISPLEGDSFFYLVLPVRI